MKEEPFKGSPWQHLLGLMIGVMILVFSLTQGCERAELATYDWRFRLRNSLFGPPPVNPHLGSIAIDDKSIEVEGRFGEWTRDKYADVIRFLGDYGARQIGFDIYFLGKSPKQSPSSRRVLCGPVYGYVVSYRAKRVLERALMQELEEELQTAHDMQMGLMPTESPEVQGFDISGRCLPANHVGGDFFQYYSKDGQLAVCMADVTGHAMEAAVPVMMFAGVLNTEVRHGDQLETLFASVTARTWRYSSQKSRR